jgi:uncharacterized protein
LENIRDLNSLRSGIIVSMVGSLDLAVLRLSNTDKMIIDGPLEIVSAEGTIAINGVHIHLAVSNVDGKVLGGHLLSGCEVQTTCEVCILETEYLFERIFDSQTGYRELKVTK